MADWDIHLGVATTAPGAGLGEGFVIVKHRLPVTPAASVVVCDTLLSLDQCRRFVARRLSRPL